MFGPKLSTVFASRWRALWWSASIILATYLFVPREEKANDPAASALADVTKALQQQNAESQGAGTDTQ